MIITLKNNGRYRFRLFGVGIWCDTDYAYSVIDRANGLLKTLYFDETIAQKISNLCIDYKKCINCDKIYELNYEYCPFCGIQLDHKKTQPQDYENGFDIGFQVFGDRVDLVRFDKCPLTFDEILQVKDIKLKPEDIFTISKMARCDL